MNKERRFVKDNSQKSKKVAILKTLQEYPEILDYYIKSKEKETNIALKTHIADPEKVNFYFDTDQIQTNFRDKTFSKILSINDCIDRIRFFKQVIESNSKILEIKGTRVQEKQLQIMFKMTTFGSLFDYNSEVNNGRGPIDFIISMGSIDKIGLELKLASSTKLKQNLKNQGDVYQIDSNLKHVIKVIFFFTDEELERVKKILNELEKEVDNYEIFIIDCRKKESASNKK